MLNSKFVPNYVSLLLSFVSLLFGPYYGRDKFFNPVLIQYIISMYIWAKHTCMCNIFVKI